MEAYNMYEIDTDILNEIRGYTVKQLKDELRRRHAPLRGRKAELYERLCAYILNDNFSLELEHGEDIQPNFFIPDMNNFKDMTSSTALPPVTRKHIELYLQQFSTDLFAGEGMYKAKFLMFVRHQLYEDVHFFHAQVRAQMFRKLVYLVNAKVDRWGVILAAHCDCLAGEGGSASCKHVAASMLGVEDMVRTGTYIKYVPCTSKLQSFNRPSQVFQGSPLKACELGTARSTCTRFDPRPVAFRNLNVNHRVCNLMAGFHSTMPLKQIAIPANPFAIDKDHSYAKEDRLQQFLRAIKHLDVTDEYIKQTEIDTRGQANNSTWKAKKKLLMTSSDFCDICTYVSEDAGKSIALRILNRTPIMTKEMEHGILNEPHAVRAFAGQYQGEMEPVECGLFLMKSRPYLGASPDRLLAEVSCVEVKCPYSAKTNYINEFTVPELICVDGSLQLKRDSPWMYQIQGQLLVTGRQYCFLVVHTYVETVTIHIDRDEDFIEEMVQKLEAFYMSIFLPVLLNQHYYRMYYDIFAC